MKKNIIRISLVFLLTIIFLFFFFRRVEWKEVFGYLTDVDLKLLILFIVLAPVHLLTRAIRWKYLLEHEKKGVGLFNRFAGNTIGFTVTFIFPGRLGELVKPLYVAQKEKMSKGFVLGTVVVERTFDMFTMCFLLGLFLVSKPLYSSYIHADADAYSNLYTWGIVGLAFAFFMLIFALSLYFFREKTLSVIAFFLKLFPKKISQKILKLFNEFIQGLKFFHSLGDFFMYVLWSFVVWLGIIFYYWIFFFAYNISVPLFFLFPYTFLVMIGASIPTPGMVGGFHYFSKLAMTSLFHIDVNQAVGMTIVIHAIQLVVTCLMGYAILWKEGISLFQLRKLGEDVKQ